MTGLEPHPVLTLPSRDVVARMTPVEFDEMRQLRLKLLESERDDPYRNGWNSPVWSLIDDLLVEGKDVQLVGRDYLEIPPEIRSTASPSLTIMGRRELLIHGTNGAGKSEYAAKKIMRILVETADALTWCFQRTEEVSQSTQQPLFWKYLPPEWKPAATGKFKQGATANITWSDKGGFTKNNFVLPNGAHCWFKFYKQDEDIIEGPQVHAIWCDEMLYEIELLKTLRYRLMKHRGILLVTFTPKSGWTPTVAEYNKGRRVLVNLTAKRLPIRGEDGKPTGEFKKMPRLAVAGPGTDGNLKANIIWLTSSDNPYLPESEVDRNLAGASEKVIMERGYGEATKAFGSKFPKFSDAIHVIEPHQLPRTGTRYHVVDPCDGRNWAMLWGIVDSTPIAMRNGSVRHRRWIYREWPSHDGTWPSANIPGIGDPGAWALPGDAPDGAMGPAQENFAWGLTRYSEEIDRLEGREPEERKQGAAEPLPRRRTPRNPLRRRPPDEPDPASAGEVIFERRMDSRFGNAPTRDRSETTTLIEMMADEGKDFLPASGSKIREGVQMINDALDYDDEVPIGAFSPALGRLNYPLLLISNECPNLIYALREWTGKDGLHGACKDFVDDLRYFFEDDLDFVGEETYSWQGGGTYS